MSRVLPPGPPLDVAEDDGLHRVHLRLWQILMTALTLAVTGWFCTMGVFPAILTVFITKHVLVAIYAAGLYEPMTNRRPN